MPTIPIDGGANLLSIARLTAVAVVTHKAKSTTTSRATVAAIANVTHKARSTLQSIPIIGTSYPSIVSQFTLETIRTSISTAQGRLSDLALEVIRDNASALIAVGSQMVIEYAAPPIILGAANLIAISTITATPSLLVNGHANLEAISTITATPSIVVDGHANLLALSTITATPTMTIGGQAFLVAISTLTAVGDVKTPSAIVGGAGQGNVPSNWAFIF